MYKNTRCCFQIEEVINDTNALISRGFVWNDFASFFEVFLTNREKGRKLEEGERIFRNMAFRTTPEEYFVKFLRFLSVELCQY